MRIVSIARIRVLFSRNSSVRPLLRPLKPPVCECRCVSSKIASPRRRLPLRRAETRQGRTLQGESHMSLRRVSLAVAFASAFALAVEPATAQTPYIPYFGKNQIRYDNFTWYTYETDHFVMRSE